jgi:N-acetylglucosaminyldiphosphoundecaprenol N-acetyl-beta-D-mannosaminyltransferase
MSALTTDDLLYESPLVHQLVSAPASSQFLDISVDAMTRDDLTGMIAEGIGTNQKWLIANHNLHSLYLFHKEHLSYNNPLLGGYFRRAKHTHIDGMSLVGLARMYGYALRREHRIAYIDWLPEFLELAAHEQWRVFYLGSAPGVIDRGVSRLRDKFPGLIIAGHHGYFNVEKYCDENRRVLAGIADFAPHLLMVGMGMPRQERWIEENFNDITANVMLSSGATLDYIAGTIPTPPRWMGRLGLEWAFRLASEPKRLSSRYLVEPWSVLKLVLQDATGCRVSNPTWIARNEVNSHGQRCTYQS